MSNTVEPAAGFENWGLSPYILQKLADLRITCPTEVQSRCWKPILEGRDLLVQSRTGTGKTLAFVLPLLHKSQGGRGSVEILVVLPTRELAMQVERSWMEVGADAALLYGGGGYAEQFGALNAGVRIVVGTPGRICDHIARGSLRLDECRVLVLDEADEILDMGFAEEVDKILAVLPKNRQTLLFSATMHENMEELAAKTLRSPQRIEISSGLAAASTIVHRAYEVEREYKHDALCNILQVENPQSALIFCHTKAEADELSERLRSDGLQAACLHGDMSQAERTRTLNAFRRGHLRYLVATDVAARGLDIRNITHVVNLSVPREAETYIHRVGRTGRAGDCGTAITLVAPRDMSKFKGIVKAAKIRIDLRPVPQREDVRRLVREAFHSEMCRRVENGVDPAYQVLARELLDYIEPADIVGVLLSGMPQAKACIQSGFDVPVPQHRQSKHSAGEIKAEQKRRYMEETAYSLQRLGRAYMQVNVGRCDESADENKLLQLLAALTGKGQKAFGRIVMKRHTSSFEVPLSEAESIASLLDGLHWEGKILKARIITPGGSFGMEMPESVKRKAEKNKGKAPFSQSRKIKLKRHERLKPGAERRSGNEKRIRSGKKRPRS